MTQLMKPGCQCGALFVRAEASSRRQFYPPSEGGVAVSWVIDQIDADVDTADHLEIRDSFVTTGIEDR